MIKDENGNTARDDGAALDPATPKDDDPPVPEEFDRMNIDGDASKESAAGHANDDANDQRTNNDGYVVVIYNGQARREKQDKADKNTITELVAPSLPT